MKSQQFLQSEKRINFAQEMAHTIVQNNFEDFFIHARRFVSEEKLGVDSDDKTGNLAVKHTAPQIIPSGFDLEMVGEKVVKAILEDPSAAAGALRIILNNCSGNTSCEGRSNESESSVMYRSDRLTIKFTGDISTGWCPQLYDSWGVKTHSGLPVKAMAVEITISSADVTEDQIFRELERVGSIVSASGFGGFNFHLPKTGFATRAKGSIVFPAVNTGSLPWNSSASYREIEDYRNRLYHWRQRGGEGSRGNFDSGYECYIPEPQEPQGKPSHKRYLAECGLRIGTAFQAIAGIATALIHGNDFLGKFFQTNLENQEVRVKNGSVVMTEKNQLKVVRSKSNSKKLKFLCINKNK